MRVPRIFVPVPLSPGTCVELDSESAHHVRSVLRLRKDSPVTLFNGQDCEYSGILQLVSQKMVRLQVGDPTPCFTESGLQIHLALGISRGERMDFSIQKSVELGVHKISPLFTERCVLKLDPKRSASKHAHWQRIARNASQQSGRTRVPKIMPPQNLASWISNPVQGLKLFLDPLAKVTLRTLEPPTDQVIVLIGPEGGLSQQEKEQVADAGFSGIRLGPRILRTETAALTAIALVQELWGDLGG